MYFCILVPTSHTLTPQHRYFYYYSGRKGPCTLLQMKKLRPWLTLSSCSRLLLEGVCGWGCGHCVVSPDSAVSHGVQNTVHLCRGPDGTAAGLSLRAANHKAGTPGRWAGGAHRQASANEPQLAIAFLFPVRRVSSGTCERAGPQSPAGSSLRDSQGLPTRAVDSFKVVFRFCLLF